MIVNRIINNGKEIFNDILKGKYKYIILKLGINNSFCNGFNNDVAINFPDVKENESHSNYGDRRKFGTINIIKADLCTFIICYCIKKKDTIIEEYYEKCKNKIEMCFPNENIYDIICGEEYENIATIAFHKIYELKYKYKSKKITSEEYSSERSKIELIRRNGYLKPIDTTFKYVPNQKKNVYLD